MTSYPHPSDYKHHQFLNLMKPTGTQKKVTVALFGMGRAGTIHLGNLLTCTRVHLKYIVEERAERRKEIENLLGKESGVQLVGVDKVDTVFKDPSVQAVVIATTTYTHTELIIKALDHGKAVFCEKPIADNNKDVKLCYDKAKKAGLPLLCSFNRRFDPSFKTLVSRVRAGDLGKLHVVKTVARDSPLPPMDYIKTSNGIFHDCIIHDIDLLCWTIGEFPTKVFASATAHRDDIKSLNDFDTVVLQMTFPGGAFGTTDISRFSVYGYDQRLEAFGPKGMLQCDNQRTQEVKHFTNEGIQDQPIFYSFPSRYDASYKHAFDHFLNVLEGKEELTVTAEQTLKACTIASAAEKSARTGQAVDIKYDF